MPQLPNKKATGKHFRVQHTTLSLRRESSGRFALPGIFGVLLIFALILLATVFRQPLSDWWRLRDYQAPADVVSLSNQDTMTDYARRMFYLNQPGLVASVQDFRHKCPENEDAIVLGCYHPGEKGIYIYNVKSTDLQGVAQVTAAHETLHAIYERLNDADRHRVDNLLLDYYRHGLSDQRVKDEIEQYKKTEPKAVVDEMHSTFGTEIVNLPPALESYYKQYFNNRGAVAAFSQRYEQAFTQRQNKITQDDKQLAAMKSQIDHQQAALRAEKQQLTATQEHLKGLLAAGQTDEYNSGVPGYNSQVQAYNAGVAELRSAISRYNQLVVARNMIAKELTDLDKALDTRLTPQAQPAN